MDAMIVGRIDVLDGVIIIVAVMVVNLVAVISIWMVHECLQLK